MPHNLIYVKQICLCVYVYVVSSYMCLVAQLCPTPCNYMDCGPPGTSVHVDSPGRNTEAGCHALLQRIFPTQGSNPGLPHGRQILYQMNHSKAQERWSG